ncbi:MAG: hypothetical protein HUJ72_04160 [Blautia sp.]|nr:hypothetical protein [Blautia sp.]
MKNKTVKRILTMLFVSAVGISFAACSKKQESETTAETPVETSSETSEESSEEASAETGIPNPWQTFETKKSAEEYAGFAIEVPEAVSDNCKAASFSVMNGDKKLLQVVYQDGDYEIVVRKSQDVGQDVSGVYGLELAETTQRNGVEMKTYNAPEISDTPDAVLTVFDYNGYAWSLYAQNGYPKGIADEFLNAVFQD